MTRGPVLALGFLGAAAVAVAATTAGRLPWRTGSVETRPAPLPATDPDRPRPSPTEPEPGLVSAVDTDPSVSIVGPVTPADREAVSLGADPIGALDECIQERFRTVEGMGLSRIWSYPEHLKQFEPETPRERSAVAMLQGRGWQVGFYLGSRRLLGPTVGRGDWFGNGFRALRQSVGGPVVLSGGSETGLPASWELQEIGREALKGFDKGEPRFETPLGTWTVETRPIRATREECLECHRDRLKPLPLADGVPKHELVLGSPLGVAFYVYPRKPE